MSGLSKLFSVSFARLSLGGVLSPNISRGLSTSSSLKFKVSPCIFAEPMKRKRKIDPAVLKAREDRKKKKIEKQIRKLEKNARQLKPLDECEIPLAIINNPKERQRSAPQISTEVLEQRVLLKKRWAKYKYYQSLTDIKMLDRIISSQQLALDELRKESEELYQEAIQIDSLILPYKIQGPVNTPPLKDFDPVDGDYQDVSKKWD